MNPWLYLVAAGAFEVAFVAALNASAGLTRLGPTLLFLAFNLASMWLLSRSLFAIPIGTAYAVWVGIGAFGAAILGIVAYGDPITLPRLFFLGLLIVSIIGLKAVSN